MGIDRGGVGPGQSHCSLRVVGHGPSLRFENRLPGGDVNPYLAVAALIAAALHGMDGGLELGPEQIRNAYTSDASRVPRTRRDAADRPPLAPP